MCVKSSLESTNGTQVSHCVSQGGRVQLQVVACLGWYDFVRAGQHQRRCGNVTGPCQKECLLQVFPLIDDGDACQACGRASSHIWQDQNLAGLNLNVTVNYTRESMLIGTTMTSFARDITTMLQSQNVQVSTSVSQAFRVASTTLKACGLVKASIKRFCYDQSFVLQAHAYALLYEPQLTAAVIVPFYPLAPLASKAEGWEISFMVSHSYEPRLQPHCLHQQQGLTISVLDTWCASSICSC